jgi:hypothetical protein
MAIALGPAASPLLRARRFARLRRRQPLDGASRRRCAPAPCSLHFFGAAFAAVIDDSQRCVLMATGIVVLDGMKVIASDPSKASTSRTILMPCFRRVAFVNDSLCRAFCQQRRMTRGLSLHRATG